MGEKRDWWVEAPIISYFIFFKGLSLQRLENLIDGMRERKDSLGGEGTFPYKSFNMRFFHEFRGGLTSFVSTSLCPHAEITKCPNQDVYLLLFLNGSKSFEIKLNSMD